MTTPKEPKHLEITEKDVEALLKHLETSNLSDEEKHQLKEIVLAMLWMGQKLEDKELVVRALPPLRLNDKIQVTIRPRSGTRAPARSLIPSGASVTLAAASPTLISGLRSLLSDLCSLISVLCSLTCALHI